MARPKSARRSAHSRAANHVRLSHLRRLCDCEQVAAVCYRIRKEQLEFLLVQTRRSRRWIFPKGNAEPGLTHAQAAALEAFEEAGVHGRMEEAAFTDYVSRRSADDDSFARSLQSRRINVHLCEVTRLCAPQEANRNRTWFSQKEARERLREDRGREEGAALARVVARAVARIKQLRGFPGKGAFRRHDKWATKDDSPGTLLLNAAGKDPLRHVPFEAPPVSRERTERPRRLDPHHLPSAVQRPVLQAEILPFDPSERKRPKALPAGKARG